MFRLIKPSSGIWLLYIHLKSYAIIPTAASVYIPEYLVMSLHIVTCQWPKTGVGLAIGFTNNPQAATASNYHIIATIHNVQSLHTNLFSLSALIFMGL
jgi:hypothetical protein